MEGSLNLIGYGIAALGSAIGVALIFYSYFQAVARQPEVSRILQPMLFVGFAAVEALAIIGFVLVLIA
ncbi:ATP synthase F0 subunit C [Nesterenkonia populi]|uniref:ATP synthase F0 subunit C n=1 Tax=Nesterenkonia populi TaxID=1591087 RepID=UPI0011BE9E33|nr:ATP synthase F0 subunit C [Nesterenkonia populi]